MTKENTAEQLPETLDTQKQEPEVNTDDSNVFSIFDTMSPEQLASVYFDKSKREQRIIDRHPCWREVTWLRATDVFGEFWAGPNISIPQRTHRHPACPTDIPASYNPDPDLLVDMVMYATGERHLSMGIYGDTGTGKTELPRYVGNLLNIPLLSVSLTKSSREDKVTGTYLIENGETFFDWSLIPIAYDRNGPGYMLVINEIDKGCDSVIAKLHDIADYKPFTIDDTAEEVLPHEQFRLVVTGQTAGSGDPRGLYKVEPLDRAFTARFFWVRAKYPGKAVMMKILQQDFPRLLNATLEPMCDFYELCVQALENSHLDIEGEDLHKVGDSELIFSTPTSVRLMKGWASLLIKYESYRSVGKVYDMSIGQSADPADKRPMKTLLETCLGDAIDQPAIIEPTVAEFPTSEHQDLTEVALGLFLHKKGEATKVWMIGADHRGSHTVYTHPETSELVYFFKPMSEFNNDNEQLTKYIKAKSQEKLLKSYVQSEGLYRYDLVAEKLFRI
ncbi:AAA family ATPase [Vibrio sp. Makdt]|uniref:AAA family ATPase n=1 Tax=Vibrio sp. Makdt TaxID=2998828 RepID=UPI0022CD91D6|nr:AAA family ATPase [Vibrio sp. Makdt]MDA0152395.1 AAA family ATPase [Vibrio sp. Makdt]